MINKIGEKRRKTREGDSEMGEKRININYLQEFNGFQLSACKAISLWFCWSCWMPIIF